MKRIVLAAIVALALVACGGGDGGSGDEDVDRAIERFGQMVDAQLKGQFSRVHEMIHPAQRELMSHQDLEACATVPIAAELESVRHKEHYTETMTIPGTDVDVEALAFTAEVRLRVGGQADGSTDTYNAIDVDGEWVFVFDGNVMECIAHKP